MNATNGHVNGKLRFSAQDWSGPNHGDRGGVFWESRKTGEKVYQATNPGGADKGQEQQTQGQQPAQTDLKAVGAKYAQQAREKWGDKAHENLTKIASNLEKDQSPEAQRKLAAVKAMLAAVHPASPESAIDTAKKPEAKPVVPPQFGLHPHATIPDRYVRYDNGKPVKIHDVRPGETNTPDSYFVTDERPGMVRDKEGEPISLQLSANNAEEKGDQKNDAGMRFRVRGDYAKTTMAVRKEYDAYLYNLGEQAVDNGSDMSEDESFTPEQAKEITTELSGHIEDAKAEIKEWYASALKGKFGERFDEYAGTFDNDVEAGFNDAAEYLDAMEAATDTDEFQDAADGFHDAIGDVMDHIDTEADKIDRQIEDEVDAETEAIETERDRVVDELNSKGWEEAKRIAGEHNRDAARRDLPYRVKVDPDGEWYYEDFSMPGNPDQYDGDEPVRYAEDRIDLDELRRMPGPEATAYAKGVLAMLRRRPDLRREFSLQDLAYLERIALDVDRYAADEPNRKFSSTQFDLAGDIAKAIREMADSIPDSDLAEDGREDKPHVTIKYGLHTSDAKDVAKIVRDFGPVEITFGEVSMFPAKEASAQRGGDQCDVVKVDIEGERLKELNKLISDSLECTDTHPEYKPHATLAYVKPGRGKKYVGDNRFKGMTASFGTMTFSDLESGKTAMWLVGSTLRGRANDTKI